MIHKCRTLWNKVQPFYELKMFPEMFSIIMKFKC